MARREMTDEQKQKMQAARAETVEEKRAQKASALKVGEWQVFRCDADNWALRKGDDGEMRYYPTVDFALRQLLHERIGEGSRKSVADLLKTIARAEAEVAAAARA